jgi:methanogenic corrinoid protein MtbC1
MDRAGVGAQRAVWPAAPDGAGARPAGPAALPALAMAVAPTPLPLQPVAPSQGLSKGMGPGPDRPEGLAGVAAMLEQQVLPRLLRRRGPHDDTRAPNARPVGARWLAALARADDDDALQGAVARLLAQGLAASAIGCDWLAPAAQELGRQWERDECGFADVTIGVGRMLRALHRLDDADPVAGGWQALAAPRILLLLAAGEQHSFGLAIVGDAFRREGWDVVGAGEVTAAQAPGCVAREHFDLVGISVGSQATAAGVPALCGALRRATRHAGMAILAGGPYVVLGGPLVTPDRLGADALAADVDTALALARHRCPAGPNPFIPATRTRSTPSSPPARESQPLARPRPIGTPAAMRR